MSNKKDTVTAQNWMQAMLSVTNSTDKNTFLVKTLLNACATDSVEVVNNLELILDIMRARLAENITRYEGPESKESVISSDTMAALRRGYPSVN